MLWSRRYEALEQVYRTLLQRGLFNQEKIMAALDDLKAAVARVEADDAQALASLKAQAAQIADISAQLAAAIAAGADPTALAALASQLDAATAPLHAALNPPAP